MTRRRLLDLGCKAGGASMGYHRAGLDVTGVDIEPQPNYPFKFIQADATTIPLDGFDAYAASMPCHDHTPLRSLAGLDGTGWLLDAVRERLQATGKPYVIENVPGAPMRADLLLCGHMFRPRLRTRRHRWFEFGGVAWLPSQPRHVHAPGVRTATKQRAARWAEGWDVSVTGDVGVYVGPEALGIDWMTGDELSNAIPPVYTEYIGRALLEQMAERAA